MSLLMNLLSLLIIICSIFCYTFECVSRSPQNHHAAKTVFNIENTKKCFMNQNIRMIFEESRDTEDRSNVCWKSHE